MDSEDQALRMSEDDFERVVLPSRGDIFSAITHLMPKSSKVKKTIETIMSTPFEPTGLEELVDDPKTIAEGLGNLKSQISNMFYRLASENYTQSSRRMAMSQTMQSSGRVVCLNGSSPITINNMLEYLRDIKEITNPDVDLIRTAFSDDNELISICSRVVRKSEQYSTYPDKRRVLNRMPYVDDKFMTIAPMKDVLLFIVSREEKTHPIYSKIFKEYTTNKASIETVENDANIIKNRFMEYFKYYGSIAACSLIKRQYLNSVKSKLWVQPSLKNDSLIQFIECLYGKSVSNTKNFGIVIRHEGSTRKGDNKAWLDTIYTTQVINTVYNDSFRISSVKVSDGEAVKNISIKDFVKTIDYQTFDSNDKLKLGIIKKIINDDDDMIRECINDKRYFQKWIKPQEYSKSGYSGRFSALVKYDNTVLSIVGEPGNLRITSSTNIIHKIQATMKMFIDINFRSESYSNASQWGNCTIWRTAHADGNCLIYQTAFYTKLGIPRSTDVKCVEFTVDKDIQYQTPDVYHSRNEIIIGDNLRTVSIKKGNRVYRVANVFQSLCLPNAQHINLIQRMVDGISNIALYETETILNLILDRKYNVSRESAKKCILSSDRFSDAPSKRVFANLMFKLKDGFEFTEEEDEEPILIEEFILTGQTAGEYQELHKTSKVEELEPEALLFEYELDFVQHERIKKFKDVMKAICIMYNGSLTDGDLDDFVKIVCNDNQIIKIVKLVSDEVRDVGISYEESINMLLEYGEQAEPSIDLFAFMRASGLDKTSYWQGRDLKYIISRHEYINYNRALLRLKLFKKEMCEHFELEQEEEVGIMDIVN